MRILFFILVFVSTISCKNQQSKINITEDHYVTDRFIYPILNNETIKNYLTKAYNANYKHIVFLGDLKYKEDTIMIENLKFSISNNRTINKNILLRLSKTTIQDSLFFVLNLENKNRYVEGIIYNKNNNKKVKIVHDIHLDNVPKNSMKILDSLRKIYQ